MLASLIIISMTYASTAPSGSCAIIEAEPTANCANAAGCVLRDIITMHIQGNLYCSDTKFIRVAMSSNDGLCNIITVHKLTTKGTFEDFDYTLSSADIPACAEKTISDYNITLLDSNTPPLDAGAIYSEVDNDLGDIPIISTCGDGIKTGIESCDNGASNNDTPAYGSGSYCTTSCTTKTASYCGDGVCDAGHENSGNCAQDCGWSTNGWSAPKGNVGWSVASGKLTASAAGIVLYSDPFDIKANTPYLLSAHVSSTNCQITVSLDSTCTSADDWTDKDCSLASGTTISFPASTDTTQTQTFTEANSTYAVNNGPQNPYFRNVRLKISTSGACNNLVNDAIISNISLKETRATTDKVTYTNSPAVISYTTGCCPTNYCWNGSICVNSTLWISNATYPAVWNSLFNTAWNNSHVNSSAQNTAIGYRCLIVNDSIGAQWIRSIIKYDWDFKGSGYCLRDTDCFVDPSYNVDYASGKTSKGCIIDGDIVGNHYCHAGGWTTRSYIVATTLQNFSAANPYILYCDNDTSLTYNFDPNSIDINAQSKILSACSILINKSGSMSLITGINFNDDSYMDTFITALEKYYNADFTTNIAINGLADCGSSGMVSGFLKCIDQDNLKAYINTNYSYVIISDRRIDAIDSGTGFTFLWTSISRAFNNLFNIKTTYGPIYNSIDYTSSYDRIYVKSNGKDIQITGIEEAKYDEAAQIILKTLYIHYNGANTANNPVNTNKIFLTANNTVIKVGKGSYMTMNYTTSSDQEEIVIKSDTSTGLWQYFTTILRPALGPAPTGPSVS